MTARRARVALALICAASALTLVLLGTRLTFFGDDWAFLLQRPTLSADALLEDHNGHLSVLPVLSYKLLVALFGFDSQLPFRLLLSASFVALGLVVYALVSERAGRVAGLVAAALLLFLGPAWEDLLWSFQIGFVGSLAAGLGALLALERDTPRRNAAACALLVLSLLLSDVGLALVVSAAVAVALRRRTGQAWIPLVPVALFALWFVAYGRDASGISRSTLLDVPAYVVDAAGAGVASLTGFAPGGGFGATTAWERPLLAIALVALAVWFLRGGRPRASVLVFLAGALTFWVLAGANFTPERGPSASRYQLVNAAFLLLIAADLFGPARLGRPAAVALLAVAAVVLVANLAALRSGYDFMRLRADNTRAALGALEIARGAVPPEFRLTVPVALDRTLNNISAGPYFKEAAKHGTPAWSAKEIVAASAEPRRVADSVLLSAYGLRLAAGGRAGGGSGCRRLRAPGVAPLPAGGAIVANVGRAPLGLAVARFAPAIRTRRLGGLAPGASGRVTIPRDAVALPWRLVAGGRSTLQVCPPEPTYGGWGCTCGAAASSRLYPRRPCPRPTEAPPASTPTAAAGRRSRSPAASSTGRRRRTTPASARPSAASGTAMTR